MRLEIYKYWMIISIHRKHTPCLNENDRAGFKRGFDDGV
jgi:hypothetical protein